MNYILAAVLSNLGYALGDATTGFAAKRNKPLIQALWGVIFGTILLTIPLILFFRQDLARLNVISFIWILVASLIILLGYWAFVAGMNKGSVTLTGVLGGSFPAVTVLVAMIIFGESVNIWQGVAIVSIVTGIILSSISKGAGSIVAELKSTGAVYGIIACLSWGVYYAIIKIPIQMTGWFLPQYGVNLIGIPLYYIIARSVGSDRTVGWPQVPQWIALAAVLHVAGDLFYNFAVTTGPTAIVAPIAGSSPAVFVVVTYFVFKEKLSRSQVLGIVLALAGIVGLSMLG